MVHYTVLISAAGYGIIGAILADAGLQVWDWHFWSILTCCLVIEMIAKDNRQ